MTKAEVYEKTIEIYKETGQGLSGIIKLGSEKAYSKYLDELVEEGSLVVCDTGGSLGHPESSRWYMPTKGYNLWTDGDNSILNLHFVRFYLDILPSNKSYKFEVTKDMIIENADNYAMYSEWLNRNYKELEIMRNLDTSYTPIYFELNTRELEYIKNCKFYNDGKNVSDFIEYNDEMIKRIKEKNEIINKLIKLYQTSDKYKEDLEKSLNCLCDNKNEIAMYERINRWLNQKEETEKIINLL